MSESPKLSLGAVVTLRHGHAGGKPVTVLNVFASLIEVNTEEGVLLLPTVLVDKVLYSPKHRLEPWHSLRLAYGISAPNLHDGYRESMVADWKNVSASCGLFPYDHAGCWLCL
ncbi:MAG: hypothetical protein ACRDAJ_06925 [Serratia fonticola]